VVVIETGSGLALREADAGKSPTGPDRMILFKITDPPRPIRGSSGRTTT
jgi:precorrin-2/cobalt-factor-2 C20-methyltransferase